MLLVYNAVTKSDKIVTLERRFKAS